MFFIQFFAGKDSYFHFLNLFINTFLLKMQCNLNCMQCIINVSMLIHIKFVICIIESNIRLIQDGYL